MATRNRLRRVASHIYRGTSINVEKGVNRFLSRLTGKTEEELTRKRPSYAERLGMKKSTADRLRKFLGMSK